MNKPLILVAVAALFTLAACKKEKVVPVHENLVVEGNKAPPYSGVTSVQIQNYVNRLYIDLLGEEPSQTQLDADVAYLKTNNLSMDARDTIVNRLIVQRQYYTKYFITTSGQMTQGIGKQEIRSEMALNTYIINSLFLPNGDTLLAQILEFENTKLQAWHDCDSLLHLGQITLSEFFKAFCYNTAYDEINMGTENFTISVFENLFLRNPTVAELQNGKDMVDNVSTQVFLQDGDSKVDFINICTTTDEFYQGRVINGFRNLLLREPTSQETSDYTTSTKQHGNIALLHKELVKTDEYAGF